MSRFVFAVMVCLTVALAVSPAAAGLFSSTVLTGDADSGISSDKTYTATVNLGGSDVTVNGVTFTGSGTNTSGTNWALTTGEGNTLYQVTGKGAGDVTGSVGGLLGDFYVTGDKQVADVLTLSGLTPGETYTLTTYGKGWTDAGNRIVNVTASDGSSTVYDEDYLGVNKGSEFHYAYIATGTTMSLSFVPQHNPQGGTDGFWDSFQFNAFSNEVGGMTPEPGSIVLLVTGMIGLLAYAWRKRK